MRENTYIARFDGTEMPDGRLLRETVALFVRNYPPMHDAADREGALADRSSPDNLRKLIHNSEALFLALDAHRRVSGLLEWRQGELEDGIYAILAWIMVDKAFQGQGIGSRLHDAFEIDVESLRQTVTKPVAQVLSVHEQNPAKALYEKWGYAPMKDKQHPKPNKIFMVKDSD